MYFEYAKNNLEEFKIVFSSLSNRKEYICETCRYKY